MSNDTDGDPQATRAMPTSEQPATSDHRETSRPSGSGRLEVRCPNCHVPTAVAADTSLTDLTCGSCGSHFSLVDQSKATRMAPSLTKLGRFDLIERLGVGGFGTVWKARDKELDRTVAIKVPRAGGMTPEEQEKFFREARAAAQLRHPSIVSVHEVGRDGDSVYIVSDFVRGVTLGDWLTGQKLTSREAAELCAKIADALHHAHEQGVVHRDLKPANIMMGYDGEPHLMDFGLARRESGEVSITIDGQVLGTPAYMSPEQAQGEAHTADRRSDVYSLGVILFQLLTGELPFRGNARMLIKQVIQDEPPSPRKLNSNVSKDLETITLKCLEKDPNRRYPTARELEEELSRFLTGEPIQARPLNNAARAIRWIRRNKTVSALSSAVALALLSGAIVSAYFAVDARRQAAVALSREKDALESKQQADMARRDAEVRQKESEKARAEEARARKESEAVVQFLVGAFKSPDPRRDGRTITVAEILDRAEKDLDDQLADQPLTQAALLNAIAESRVGLGLWTEAHSAAKKASDLRSTQLGADHRDTLNSMRIVARALMQLVRWGEATQLYEQILTAQRKNLGPHDPDTLATMQTLSYVYDRYGQREKAIELAEEVVEVRRNTLGNEHSETLSAMERLASAHGGEKGIELQQNVLSICRKNDDEFRTQAALNALAVMYQKLGQFDESIPLFHELIFMRKRVLGADHPDTLQSMENLGMAYFKQKRADEAILHYEAALAGYRRGLGVDNWSTLNAMRTLALINREGGRTAEAVRLYEETLIHARDKFPTYPITGETAGALAKLYSDGGQIEKAISTYEESLNDARKRYGDFSNYTRKQVIALAEGYRRAGRPQPKLKLFEDIQASKETNANTLNEAAWLLATSEIEAVRDGERAVELATKACELTEYKDPTIIDTLAAAYAESGDFDSAVKWSDKSLELVKDSDDAQLGTTLSRALETYKAKKPIREPAEGTP